MNWLFIATAFAQATITVSPAIPGLNTTGANAAPGAFIANFYQFALLISGILAFGAIVYGGVLNAISAGNPSKQSEGKSWITSALLGLLLLAGAYIILYTINPNLINLNLSGLTALPASTGSGGSDGGTFTGTGCAGGICQTLPNCTPVAGVTNCGGAIGMVSLMTCINQADPNYTVNEGYPPIGSHSDPRHNVGCAIDVHIPNGNCAAIAPLQAAAVACGAPTPLNEYVNCGGQSYANTTGGNIHIQAPNGSGGC